MSIADFKYCKNCGIKFYLWWREKFCSRKCAGAFRRGKKYPIWWRKALSLSKIGKYRDEKSPHWKGEKVGYGGLHEWVYRKLGSPNICEHCKKRFTNNRQLHWANKSRTYKRDVKDWIRLCASCHKKYDRLIKEKNGN